jgi:hypothetical protein
VDGLFNLETISFVVQKLFNFMYLTVFCTMVIESTFMYTSECEYAHTNQEM